MTIKDQAVKAERPIKAVQFGEGNFLRAFVDYMLDIANEKGIFDGSIAVVKPISSGSLDAFREQDNLYTVLLRGKENGEIVNDSRIITSVSQALDCADDYEAFMALAFLTLAVIPKLKIVDKGLFDVEKFAFTEIEA